MIRSKGGGEGWHPQALWHAGPELPANAPSRGYQDLLPLFLTP
jgi:hypothetical protein